MTLKKRPQNKTNGSRAQLREYILTGKYMVGTTLPSSRELAQEMGISKTLVHNALKLLQEEGLIKISHGRGAVVLEHSADKPFLRRFFWRPSDYGTFRYLPIAGELLKAVAAGAEMRNVEMLVSFSDSAVVVNEIIAHYLAGTIQGVIYSQCSSRELIQPLIDAKIPYVIADDNHGFTDFTCSYVDYREVARKAVRYLYQKGHRSIGMISGSKQDYVYAEMLAGFRGALAEEDLSYKPNWVLNNIAFEQATSQVELIRKYLTQAKLPSAIFTTRDYRAEWLYKAAELEGIRIPEDLSVISFDNVTWTGGEGMGLTTIEEPLHFQGEQAVAMLQQWVNDGKQPSSQKAETKLIERSSVLEI